MCIRDRRSAWASSMRVRSTGSAVASAQPTVSPARISWVKSSASGAIVIGVFTRLLALSSRWGLVELYEPRGRVAFDHLIRAVEKSPSAAKRIRLLRAISDTRPNGGFPTSTSACRRQAWCQNQLFRRAEGSGYLRPRPWKNASYEVGDALSFLAVTVEAPVGTGSSA